MTTFAQSCPPRDADGMAAFAKIDGAIAAVAGEMGAAAMSYPTLIARDSLEQAGYPEAFPHLMMLATSLRDPEIDNTLAAPQWCLSPAVCYHVYASLAGQELFTPRIVTASGRCFRNEAALAPGERQIEFDMREIVLLGARDWVRATARTCKEKLERTARQLALHGEWSPAEDPFFLPRAGGKVLMQRLKEAKLEYRVNDLALASVNFHDDFFGRRFDIRDAAGEFLHTACIAAGVNRWVSQSNLPVTEVCTCHR